jgi:MFS transporter, ACS family, solute carrier family 17 (sodium-dependent inorganic phosphate cotransporter), member 5
LWGTAAAMIGVAYSGCDRAATVILLTLAVAVYGALLGGILINLIDIAPNYASILLGITNSFATLSGFASPWVAGAILKGNVRFLSFLFLALFD